jgi:hypothetical protein
MTSMKGSCLCGAVNYEISGEPKFVGNCYCVDCRKSSGTGHCTNVIVATDDVAVTGDLKFFDRPADSDNMISRGFCPECGSAIMTRNSTRPGMVGVRASSLDNPDQITPGVNVYSCRAPSWDQPDESIPTFEKMPPPPK